MWVSQNQHFDGPFDEKCHLIQKLKKIGHSVTHLPVIKIQKLETKKVNLKNYKAVIFTSSNAIRFMNIEKFNSKIKCFCVGKATEFTAKQFGFINAYSSEGTVTVSYTHLTLPTNSLV